MRKPVILSILVLFSLALKTNAQNHFTPVDSTGLPYQVIIVSDSLSSFQLKVGDEIGLFDDTLCVGADIYNGQNYFPITTWEGALEYNLKGFTKGDTIGFKAWTDLGLGWDEHICKPTFSIGDGTFSYGTYSICTLTLADSIEVKINPYKEIISAQYELWQNYPNPFNSFTIIPYQINEPMHIRIVIYNLMGQDVVVLVDGWKNPEQHYLTWDGKDMYGKLAPSGVYFYHFGTVNEQVNRKLMLLR